MLFRIPFEERTNISRIGGRFIDKKERSRHAKEIASGLSEQVIKLPGVEKFSASAVSAIQKAFLGGSLPISIDILGRDIEMTNEVAAKIRRIVESTPGAVDVSISRKKPRPEVLIRLDRDKAASLGLNVALVADALRTNYYGCDDTKFREAGDDFDIELRLKKDQRKTIREIGETLITTLTGQTIKLRNVASVRETFGPVEIDRKTGLASQRFSRASKAGFWGMWYGMFEKRWPLLTCLPAFPSNEEVEEQRKAFSHLTLLLILGIVLVYMVIAGEFEDFVDPFIIMFSVPFAFVGVIWAFVFTATPLNLMSFIGVIMLMGIVVKNAIVLVDYTKQLRAQGMTLNEASVTGGRTRLWPVLMTSLITIFGMVPLALTREEGSEIWNALGITVIGGLLVSGLVTLILVPLMYSLVHRGRAK